MTKFWWVNQNQSYGAERREGILWAPFRTADGRGTRQHWESMDEVQPGDVILHFAGGHVVATSRALTTARPSRRPESLPTDQWDQDGRLLRSEYVDAQAPVARDDIPEDWRRDEPTVGPFQVNLGIKQGYLFPLSDAFGQRFSSQFGDSLPGLKIGPRQGIVPAEAQAGALDLLRRLIGIRLTTITGSTNTILGVTPSTATVSTGRSPEGQPVPVDQVQSALDRLVADGACTITPAEVGYRSAFVGAVLLTLPDTYVEGTPPVVRLRRDDQAPDERSGEDDRDGPAHSQELSFQGDLSHAVEGVARGEQAHLRRRLFGAATEAACAICGETYPVRFLWAAHIKKRAACSDDEKRDLANVAMPACVFGCDALYEAGYLSVNGAGYVVTAQGDHPPALAARLTALSDRPCSAYTEASSAYFSWHLANVWRR